MKKIKNVFMNYLIKPKIARKNGKYHRYHHFLFGYYLPFLLNTNPSLDDNYLFYDCQKLNYILLDTPHYNTNILTNQNKYDILSFPGFDGPYNPGLTYSKIELINEKINNLYNITYKSTQDYILLIDRGGLDNSKNKKYKEYKNQTPSERRSIMNTQDIYMSLNKIYPTKIMQLDGLPLLEQIALFRSARIIIAQHGAALSNIIFCNPYTKIIEIIDNGITSNTLQSMWFDKLYKICNRSHIKYSTKNSHPILNIQNIEKSIKFLINN
jgi:hypothetical protein